MVRNWNTRRDGLGLAATVGIAWLWTSLALWLRPAHFFSDDFLFRDAGFSLVAVDHLLAGGKLYQELFYQYGPLPAYFHAAVAWALGNTAETYVRMFQAFCIVDAAICYLILRRVASALTVNIILLVGIYPTFILPGSFAAVSIGPSYPPFERTVLLLLALFWNAPARRDMGRSVLLGVLLGLMCWIKFGGAFVAGAALILMDSALLLSQRADWGVWRHWIGRMLITGAVFSFVQAMLALFLVLTCSRQVALDALWPAYMIQNYESYVGGDRFPHWINWRYFLGTQLPFASSLILWLWAGASFFRRSPRDMSSDDKAGPSLLLGLFFVIGVFAYFKHAWLIMDYAWIIVMAAGWALSRCPEPIKFVVLLLWLPCAVFNWKTLLPQTSDYAKSSTTIGAEHLWLDASVARRVQRLEHELRAVGSISLHGEALATLVVPIPPGLYHYYHLSRGTRHAWLMPGVVRNYDERQLIDSLDRTAAVILFLNRDALVPPQPDPRSWDWSPFKSSPLGERFSGVLAARLKRPIEIDSQCFLFPVIH